MNKIKLEIANKMNSRMWKNDGVSKSKRFWLCNTYTYRKRMILTSSYSAELLWDMFSIEPLSTLSRLADLRRLLFVYSLPMSVKLVCCLTTSKAYQKTKMCQGNKNECLALPFKTTPMLRYLAFLKYPNVNLALHFIDRESFLEDIY